jgi:hypothetical protein
VAFDPTTALGTALVSLCDWIADSPERKRRELQRQREREFHITESRQVHELAATWPCEAACGRRDHLARRLRPLVFSSPGVETLVAVITTDGAEARAYRVATGEPDRVVVRTDMLERLLLREGARTCVIAHNHRRSLEESEEDERLRENVAALCARNGIGFLDSLIVMRHRAWSFMQGREYAI